MPDLSCHKTLYLTYRLILPVRVDPDTVVDGLIVPVPPDAVSLDLISVSDT